MLNTNSRSCGEAEAADHVGAACEAIRARSGTLIYKKIDSTLRGHVGLEIDFVSDLMEFGLVVCAPAYPEMRRTTVGAYQLLHGVPVRSRDMAGPDIPPPTCFHPGSPGTWYRQGEGTYRFENRSRWIGSHPRGVRPDLGCTGNHGGGGHGRSNRMGWVAGRGPRGQ